MEAPAQVIPCTLADVRDLIAPAMAHDTTAGAFTLDEILAGAQCFALVVDGRAVLGYALDVQTASAGAVVWVKGAGGRLDGADLTATAMQAIEAQAQQAGARQVALTTARPGLRRKLERMGYRVTGVTLRKTIQ